MTLQEKKENLINQIKSYGRVAVAFSAGADSTLLLKMCIDTLGKENVIAISAYANAFPKRERKDVESICKELNANNIQFEINQLNIEHFAENTPQRCYYCKKAIFNEITKIANKNGFHNVLEGSNLDDESDYRPGMKAIKELGISSPLKDSQLTKDEIRRLSKELGLSTYSKPSSPCLATRIEYYEKITDEKLKKTEKAEQTILDLGIEQVRVRMHGNSARIEVNKKSMQSVLDNSDYIYSALKKIGFDFISLSLSPYKTGSMNINLK